MTKTALSKPPSQKVTNQTIRAAIEKNDSERLKQFIDTSPDSFKSISPNYLKICCLSNKPQLISIILHTLPLTPNQQYINESIIESIRFQKLDFVKLFVHAGFNVDQIVLQKKGVKFTCLDFAILGGHYQIAQFLYKRVGSVGKNLRNVKEYELIGKQYQYRYVNYQMVVEGLTNNLTKDQMGNYLKKQLSQKRKQQIRRMYEQGCWDWLMRVLGFSKCNKKCAKQGMIDSASSKYPNPSQKQTDYRTSNNNKTQNDNNFIQTERHMSTKQSSTNRQTTA